MKTLCVFLILFSLAIGISAQNNPGNYCLTDWMTQQLLTNNPRMQAVNDSLELQIFRMLDGASGGGARQIFTIPIVVHIVHNNGSENISDAQVQAGIQHMNDAFHNLGFYNQATGVDVGIEFCLATQDTNSNATTGITRTQSVLTDLDVNVDDFALKDLARWDQTKYLNIWLVRAIRRGSSTSVLAYSSLPFVHGNHADGIVCEANFFGVSEPYSNAPIHEAGHYLGLFHTFDNGCTNVNCLVEGDRVCDTPPDNATNGVPCSGSFNSCNTDDDDLSLNNPFRPLANGGIGDQNDLVNNYMDYGNLFCLRSFTPGQKNRMVSMFTSMRSSLLLSPGCQPPCLLPVNASFTASSTNVITGTTVNFTNTSTNATSYSWKINGVQFSTAANPSHIFTSSGSFTVSLTASGSNPSCQRTFSMTITASCPAQANFTASATFINPGGTITFTNTSTGATHGYQWFIDSAAVSAATNLIHTFAAAGIYRVHLVAASATCSDASAVMIIQVGCKGTSINRQNFWYFGFGAGLDFNGGAPVALTNSMMGSAFQTCATISDESGDLLFYTDGDTVWNDDHLPMPNGVSLGGEALDSLKTGPPVFIIPKPGSQNIYYIFNYKLDLTGGASGLMYHTVDLSLDNGNGDVTFSSGIVLPDISVHLVMPHSNGMDYWLISRKVAGKKYYAYLLTAQGFNLTPVVSSNVGTIDSSGTREWMVASPDLKKIAASESFTGFEILDFDNTSGLITDANHLFINQTGIRCIEFSPDGSKFYGIHWPISQNFWGFIDQWDLSAGSNTAITNSRFRVTPLSYQLYMPTMQRAPDGKIYLNNYHTYLSTIDSPNLSGVACGFNLHSFHLAGKSGALTFPFFVNFNSPRLKITGPATVTEGDLFVPYGINFPHDTGSVYTWTLHGTSTMQSQTDTTIVLHIGATGTDTLIITKLNTCSFETDTLVIRIAPVIDIFGKDTALCNGTPIILDAGAGYSSYLWQNGDTTRTLTASSPGTYWVQVTTTAGYTGRDTIEVLNRLLQPPTITSGGITSLCPGNLAVLDAGAGYASYLWNDGWTQQTYTAIEAGIYSVTVADPCGATASASITLNEHQVQLVDFGDDTALCNGVSSITLELLTTDVLFVIWQDGSSGFTYLVTQPGTYWAEATDSASGCADRDTIEVFNSILQPPTITGGDSTTLCPGEFTVLDAGGSYTSYLWNNGWTEQTDTVYENGIYSVTVTDLCGSTASASITVKKYLENLVDFGDDTVLCSGASITLELLSNDITHVIWQDGSSGVTYQVTQPGTYWVDVTDSSGCTDKDTIEVGFCTAISSSAAQQYFSVYPNPAKEKLHVIIHAEIAESPLELVNSLGKKVFTRFTENEFDLDVSTYARGIYFLRLQTKDRLIVQKIILL